MNLDAYLERIGFRGKPRPDRNTLIEIHRRHLLNISYENVDVQFGKPVGFDVNNIFEKIVTRRRGGWCYEMNGLLEWALRETGFDVTRVNGGVMREERGDFSLGNHLVLLVHLDRTWLADVGFGDGILEPVPLKEAKIVQRGFRYLLEKLDDGYWRFRNHRHAGAPSFDFLPEPADEKLFRDKCDFLQTSEESPFVMNLVCQRFVADGYQTQVGRVAKHITKKGVDSWLIDREEELVERLYRVFDLDVPEVISLWPRIVARHEELFGDEV